MAGKGAASGGVQWNHVGEHVTCAATSISLAAWETRAYFAKAMMLPWNRILVRIDVPDAVWAARVVTPLPLPVGWNVVPEGMISRSIGSAWLAGSVQHCWWCRW
jgi:RES domain-containing protein